MFRIYMEILFKQGGYKSFHLENEDGKVIMFDTEQKALDVANKWERSEDALTILCTVERCSHD